MEGRIRPGEAIPELKIASRFKVSRTPIREALLRLANEELVEIVPQVGSFVSKLRLQQIREALFVREAIECQVVSKLATTPEAYASLQVIDDVLRAHQRGIEASDLKQIFAADDAFHRTLVVAAGLPGLWETLARARQAHSRIRAISVPEMKGAEQSVVQHATILKRILGGDSEGAAEAMREHILLNWGFAQTIADHHPEFFE